RGDRGGAVAAPRAAEADVVLRLGGRLRLREAVEDLLEGLLGLGPVLLAVEDDRLVVRRVDGGVRERRQALGRAEVRQGVAEAARVVELLAVAVRAVRVRRARLDRHQDAGEPGEDEPPREDAPPRAERPRARRANRVEERADGRALALGGRGERGSEAAAGD